MKIANVKQMGSKMQKDIVSVKKLGEKLEQSLEQFQQALALLDNSNELATETPKQKRKPGRPKKEESKTVVNEQPKRKPGRPKKNKVEQPVVAETKKKPGRPKKNKVEQPVVAETKRKPGRPKKNNETVQSNKNLDMVGEINRIKNDLDSYNQWVEVNDSDKIMAVIENATYRGEVVGFYSKGTSGRFGITTRVYLNPDSTLVPEELKHHITTAAVNRIRYVENEAEGLDYIEKQKVKVQKDYFDEVMPTVLKDHGKKGSDYAFHLDKTVRRNFKNLKSVYDTEYKHKIEKSKVMA